MPIPTTRAKEKAQILINTEKCTGCGLCVSVCKDFSLEIKDKKVVISDASVFGCIGCGLCAKNCPSQAIEFTRNLAKIDQKKCTDCGLCETKCPTKAIVRI